ncbi:hypothetical protein F9K91_07735 [Brucella tritici]|uniref:Uncharacterized protein n=3 Tax=Brucella/Ochrobactrum group TaxID=2826938 RepID=A0A7Y3T6T4_9HYPH|nr:MULTISPECIES: hypothetical protein [Brucella]KAB2666012.1 hypothetical protein F9K91_07735 [Brucella tritici]KAB2699339.1 hypothetical protein F9K79_09605 [Ochrobactrum sp. Kaboul]MCH4539078.1 hypothetical protein [Ochrobactrum sp. A-1]NNV22080.1 hypothetical protein [Brucella pseudogrignonensis]
MMATAAKKKPAAKKAAAPKKVAVAPTPKSYIADQVVNQQEMSRILRVSDRFLRIMTTDGVLSKTGVGYAIGDTVRAYADHLKEGAVKKTGSESLDKVREEKALDLRMNRMRKDRELITLDEALSVADELAGLFLSYLNGLPAEITGAPRERQRLNDIIDKGRLRLADRLAKKIADLRSGEETSDAEAED